MRAFDRDRAAPGQRADERGRAASGALDLGRQRQPASHGRPAVAGEERGDFGAAQSNARTHGQAFNAAGERQPAVETSVAELAADLVEHQL